MESISSLKLSSRGCHDVMLRLFAVLFGVGLAWFLLEIFVRVGFTLLPPDAQEVVQLVRRVPWNDERLVLPLPYITSREHQAQLAPGHDDYPVRWGDASFTFDTISLWEMPLGFRTHEPRWPVEIVAIGDSYTFCWTEEEDCWVNLLETEYGWSIMNLGIPGTGARAHQTLIEPYVRPLEPKIVIWQWYGNDYQDEYDFAMLRGEDVSGLTTPPAAYIAPTDFGKFAEYSAVYRLLRAYSYYQKNPRPETSVIKNIHGQNMIFFDNLHWYDFQYGSVQWGAERSFEVLESSHETLTSLTTQSGEPLNTEVIYVLIPAKEEVYEAYLDDFLTPEQIETLKEGRRRMMAQCEAQGWHCIDMFEPFQQAVENGERVYHGFDFHIDASGNQIVADTIATYLIEHDLLEAKQ